MLPEIVQNTPQLVAVLAALALDELTPIQTARVEERLQLLATGPLPAASWLTSRLVSRRRRVVLVA